MIQQDFFLLYNACFPEKDAEKEIEALGTNFEVGILDDKSFVIFKVLGDEAEIIDLGTHPEHRKTGLAQELITGLVDDLEKNGVGKVFLEVAVDNEPALNLYRKLGFEEFNRRKDYYKRGNGRIDAILMRKIL